MSDDEILHAIRKKIVQRIGGPFKALPLMVLPIVA
jgi:hypothetical protein